MRGDVLDIQARSHCNSVQFQGTLHLRAAQSRHLRHDPLRILKLLRFHRGGSQALIHASCGTAACGTRRARLAALHLVVLGNQEMTRQPKEGKDSQEAELNAQHVQTFIDKFDDRFHGNCWTLGFVQNKEELDENVESPPQGEEGRILRRA